MGDLLQYFWPVAMLNSCGCSIIVFNMNFFLYFPNAEGLGYF